MFSKFCHNAALQTQNSPQILNLSPLMHSPNGPIHVINTVIISQRLTLLPAYFYQKDERALPPNLQNSKPFWLPLPI
jgi:hypothetical protein